MEITIGVPFICCNDYFKFSRMARTCPSCERTNFNIAGASLYASGRCIRIKDSRKIIHHLIPNVFPLLIVVATLGVAGSILSESALSYLGLGVVPPTPSWGT